MPTVRTASSKQTGMSHGEKLAFPAWTARLARARDTRPRQIRRVQQVRQHRLAAHLPPANRDQVAWGRAHAGWRWRRVVGHQIHVTAHTQSPDVPSSPEATPSSFSALITSATGISSFIRRRSPTHPEVWRSASPERTRVLRLRAARRAATRRQGSYPPRDDNGSGRCGARGRCSLRIQRSSSPPPVRRVLRALVCRRCLRRIDARQYRACRPVRCCGSVRIRQE